MTPLVYFLSGAVTLGFFAAGLFFLRFWRRTGDTLFLAFSLAFGLLGFAQCIIAMTNDVYVENRSVAYLIRLAAFAIIIVAIGRKNRKVL